MRTSKKALQNNAEKHAERQRPMSTHNNKKKKTGVNLSDVMKTSKKVAPSLSIKNSLLDKNVPVVKTKRLNNSVNKTAKKREPELNQEMMKGLRNPSLYLLFCDWMAQPDGFRVPATQELFSKMHNVGQNTLTAWKNRDGFWSTVEKRIKSQWREKTGLIIQSVFRKVLKDGSGREAELLLQYIVGFNSKNVQPEAEPIERQFDPAKLAEMTLAMKNAGLAGTTEHHEKLKAMFNDVALTDEDDLGDIDDNEIETDNN